MGKPKTQWRQLKKGTRRQLRPKLIAIAGATQNLTKQDRHFLIMYESIITQKQTILSTKTN